MLVFFYLKDYLHYVMNIIKFTLTVIFIFDEHQIIDEKWTIAAVGDEVISCFFLSFIDLINFSRHPLVLCRQTLIKE